jgi:phosphohistidine phosphatase SixA
MGCVTSPLIARDSVGELSTVSIFIVRHGETDPTQPKTLPLSSLGLQRADILASTVRGVSFTNAFATHTVRARQMIEKIALKNGLQVVQLPTPGSIVQGETVTDLTTRRAAIDPVSAALLKLPSGSVVIVALNSENIYAILNRLGIPTPKAGESCVVGTWCVPCLDNTCYPAKEFDHLWHIVLDQKRGKPISFTELRYGIAK